MKVNSYSVVVNIDQASAHFGATTITLYSFDLEQGEPENGQSVIIDFDKDQTETANHVLDLVRNEEPLYYNGGLLMTGREPAGEHEVSEQYENPPVGQ